MGWGVLVWIVQGEEDLDTSVRPDVDLKKLFPLGREVEGDAVHVAREGGGADQENDEDGVGEKSGEVDQLKWRLFQINISKTILILLASSKPWYWQSDSR